MNKHFLIIVLSVLFFFSCNSDERKIVINDFSKKINDTLVPTKGKSYAAAKCIISGTSNDTIIIEFNNIERRFIGQFNYKFDMDYYGGNNVEFGFKPYKATSGTLTAKYGIY